MLCQLQQLFLKSHDIWGLLRRPIIGKDDYMSPLRWTVPVSLSRPFWQTSKIITLSHNNCWHASDNIFTICLLLIQLLKTMILFCKYSERLKSYSILKNKFSISQPGSYGLFDSILGQNIFLLGRARMCACVYLSVLGYVFVCIWAQDMFLYVSVCI